MQLHFFVCVAATATIAPATPLTATLTEFQGGILVVDFIDVWAGQFKRCFGEKINGEKPWHIGAKLDTHSQAAALSTHC